MDELKDVQDAGIVFADAQHFVPSDKCENIYAKCISLWECGKSSYTGQWKDMMPHGRGTLIVEEKDKTSKKVEQIKRYDGMWKNGVVCGEGRLIYVWLDNDYRTYSFLEEGEFDANGHSATGSR